MQRANLPDDWEVPEPTLPDWLMFVWLAWWRLHCDRPYYGGGMGAPMPGRIPWRDVLAWAEYHDMSGGTFALLDKCIRAMDDTYLAWYAAKASAQANSAKKGKG